MGITIFILLFSIGTMALLAVLLKAEKIQQSVFAAGIALLVVFDFSLLSLDKIYFLHQEQDELYLERQKANDENMAKHLVLYKQLTNIQLDTTLQILAQNTKQSNEQDIAQKVKWRDELLAQMTLLEFEEARLVDVSEKINGAVVKFLMEQLNQEVRQTLGHRIYSEFVRSRPRQEWTDDLFVSELELYLNDQNIMKPAVKIALTRLKEFKSSGVLMNNKKNAETDEPKKEK